MDPEERDEQERQRPRVVDKRVASGGHQPPPKPAPPPEPPPQATPPPHQAPQNEAAAPPSAGPELDESGQPIWTPEEEAQAMQMAQEIAERPGIDWVVNTAVTLANVAATKLQVGDPADAQLCIDALAGILSSTPGRLQDAEAPLKQTLAQLQMAYAQRVTPPPPAPGG